ncbi:MAG: CHAD domain-containing protein, partial [Vicinamibacterales bacterium]
MAFHLKPDEPIAAGLRRIVRTELRFAIDQLDAVEPSDEAIHEARKSIKKVRAVLKLCGGMRAARRVPRSLRRAAHLLAPVRDADAVIVTLCDLTTDQPGALSTKAAASLREQLLQDKATIAAVARRDRVANRAAKVLRGVRRSTAKWEWTSVGVSELTVTVRRTYKRARKSMRTARRDGRADA